VKKIKRYTQELHNIRQIASKIQDMNLEDIQKRTLEIKESFAHIDFENSSEKDALKSGLEAIKLEAAALWLQACKCLYKQEFQLES